MGQKTIALDLGGTRIKIGIVEGGTLLADTVIDAFSTGGLIPRLPAIDAAVSSLLAKCGLRPADTTGVAIAIPGIVDTKAMRLISVNKKYTDAVDLDFSAWAQRTWHLPLLLENDARSALVGEWQYGAGRGCDNLAMLTLGTGIGGAVLIEGKVLRGKHFQAGCLPGHFTINFHGTDCTCGNTGCAESEASSWRLPDLAVHHPLFASSPLSRSPQITYQEVFTLADTGDQVSLDLVNHSLDAWGALVVTLIHAYDPERVVLGGGIMRSAPRIIPGISSLVEKHAWTPWGNVAIVPAELSDHAALFGVSYLFCHEAASAARQPAS